jgi:hypothetical protein
MTAGPCAIQNAGLIVGVVFSTVVAGFPFKQTHPKNFQKGVAFIFHFDRLPAPRRPKGREDSILFADR